MDDSIFMAVTHTVQYLLDAVAGVENMCACKCVYMYIVRTMYITHAHHFHRNMVHTCTVNFFIPNKKLIITSNSITPFTSR